MIGWYSNPPNGPRMDARSSWDEAIDAEGYWVVYIWSLTPSMPLARMSIRANNLSSWWLPLTWFPVHKPS